MKYILNDPIRIRAFIYAIDDHPWSAKCEVNYEKDTVEMAGVPEMAIDDIHFIVMKNKEIFINASKVDLSATHRPTSLQSAVRTMCKIADSASLEMFVRWRRFMKGAGERRDGQRRRLILYNYYWTNSIASVFRMWGKRNPNELKSYGEYIGWDTVNGVASGNAWLDLQANSPGLGLGYLTFHSETLMSTPEVPLTRALDPDGCPVLYMVVKCPDPKDCTQMRSKLIMVKFVELFVEATLTSLDPDTEDPVGRHTSADNAAISRLARYV